uniref:helix-turn-helix domain-containing protein n=2 Tax=Gelidibacter sp. TaxID=2018083 RepID=UPI00404A8342
MANEELEVDKNLKLLSERLKKLRKEKGYSNYELFAFDNDIPRAQYGRYEKGSDLRFSSLIKIIHALGYNLKDFFSEGFDD